MKPLALIPARGGSKRIPRKNIIDFCGKPMLAWPLEAAKESGLFDTIHVSTEDAEIRGVAEGHGADVSLTRPETLADDVTPLLPLARWVVEAFDARGQRFDDIFILYPSSPLLEAQDLRGAYELYLANGRSRNLLTVARSPVPAEWFYRRREDGRLDPVTPGGAFTRSQDLETAWYETGAFTIFSREWLLGSETLQDDKNYIGYPMPSWRSVDIDEPEDLEFAAAMFAYARSQR